jgi:hypothetical protein
MSRVNEILDIGNKYFITTPMSRKRTPLHQSINSLAASLPDIPSVVVGGESHEPLVGGHCDHETEIPVSASSADDLFAKWSRTPEGHQARDSRIPTDPVRLGCILDDNARIAFMAGYAAATPSFE